MAAEDQRALAQLTDTDLGAMRPRERQITLRAINVRLAQQLRAQHVPIREIAERLGKRPATIKAYLWDPDGTKTRKLRAGWQGRCQHPGCANPTTSNDGRGRARDYCAAHRGEARRRWTRERIIAAMLEWASGEGAGQLPTSHSWAGPGGGQRPSRSTVEATMGGWQKARAAAARAQQHAAQRG